MTNFGSKKKTWLGYHHRRWNAVEGEVIAEQPITIYVNGVQYVTVMGTPLNQDWLAVGFLTNEGVIDSPQEILDLRVMPSGCCVDVWLDKNVEKPKMMIVTSGCGGGVTYNDPRVGVDPFRDQLKARPEQILAAFNHLQSTDSLYARARGVHAAGLLNLVNDQLLMVAEDVGRHNTIDKIRGACLLQGIQTQGRAILTTGRISSEMLWKCALMGCPVVASRTSPTSLAVEIAQDWQLTLVGYARQGKLRVYSAPERLGVNAGLE